MYSKYLLIVASALAVAQAKTDCSSNLNVTSQTDLDGIASCSTYSGDITLTETVTTAAINGVQNLEGSLSAVNATQLVSLTAPTLVNITGSFELRILNALTTLTFPMLESAGSINWVTLPGVSGLQFTAQVSNASDIIISDTGLLNLEGINVTNVNSFEISNNRFLNEVNVALETVGEALDISFNAPKVTASFPDLIWANNVTFQDVQSISLPQLSSVNASAGFINNTINGLALPNLKTVGESLAVVSNSQLTNVSFPQLVSIGGGFDVENNTNLNSVLGFPKVKSVGGAIVFKGNFSAASLPSLTLVKGGVDVESSATGFNCSSWNSAHSNGDIQGDSYQCKAASSSTSVAIHATSAVSGSGSAAAASATGSTSKSKGGAVPVGLEYTSLVGAALAFVFQFV